MFKWMQKYLNVWNDPANKPPKFYCADVNPTVNDGPSTGFGLYSRWVNSRTLEEYVQMAPTGSPNWRSSSLRVYDVREFGVVGDGTVDDTAAILKAINTIYPAPHNPDFGEQWGVFNWYMWKVMKQPKAQGAVLTFPKGTFKITSSLPLRGFVRLIGQGPSTVIKANLPSNTTSGAFYSEVDGINYCSCPIVSDMDLWTEYGYGFDLTKGALGLILKNLKISSNNWAVYTPDNAYLQGCSFKSISVMQLGGGGLRLVGNLNRVEQVSIGGSGWRDGVDRAAVEAIVVVKGSGWVFEQLHIETGLPVKCMKIGGPGPAYGGYCNDAISINGMWLENEGDPVDNVAFDLIDVRKLNVTNISYVSSGKVRVKNCMNVYFDTAGPVVFDPTDKTSTITVDAKYNQWGHSCDYSEERIIVKRLTNQYCQEQEVVPTGRFGNILQPLFSVDQRASNATMTYVNVPNVGWCWKVNWTAAANGGFFDITVSLLPPAGVINGQSNLFLSALLDWSVDTSNQPLFTGFLRFYFGFGANSFPYNANWDRKGQCTCKFNGCDNLAGSTLMRVFTNNAPSGEFYLKNFTASVSGRFQPPPAPAKFIYSSDGPCVFWHTANPMTSMNCYFLKGSICYNLNPISGGPAGWICLTSGTPGTWRTFGTVSTI